MADSVIGLLVLRVVVHQPTHFDPETLLAPEFQAYMTDVGQAGPANAFGRNSSPRGLRNYRAVNSTGVDGKRIPLVRLGESGRKH